MKIECYHIMHEDQKIKGFFDYQYCSEVEEIIKYNVYEVLENIDEINYICIYAHGSRVFGNPRKDSDLDFVLFYKGNIKEDSLFNIFTDESIYIEHIKCDFNPIEIDDDSDIEYYIQKHDIEYNNSLYKNDIQSFNTLIESNKINLALALDDYENTSNGFVPFNYNDSVNNQESIKQLLDLNKYTVDLGLPSGTRWCKFNMGCDKRFNFDKYKYDHCDGKSDWYGNYYAWGELDGMKDTYSVSNYKYAIDSGLVYYVNDKYSHKGLTQLLPEDDVVCQKLNIHNFKFHIPTKEQMNELIDNTYHEWKNNYLGYEGLNGMLFYSKINDDNRIFLPAAGFYKDSEFMSSGKIGIYQTSELSSDSDSELFCFWFDNSVINKPHPANHQKRYLGISIRPVIDIN